MDAVRKRQPAKRRHVGDDELARALADRNNTNMMFSVLKRYRNLMDADTLKTCGLHAMWRALQYHDPTRPSKRNPGQPCGQKFTTSLVRFCHYECRRELRRLNGLRRDTVSLSSVGEPAGSSGHDKELHAVRMATVRDKMRYLPRGHRALLREHFFDRWTLEEIADIHGISKEAVRQKLAHAVRYLRELCDDPEPPVYSLPA